MNRRQFLQQSAQSALAIAAAPALAEGAQPDPAAVPPIVDTHQHLWDLQRFRLPWVQRDSPLNRNFVSDDYVQATRGLNVVKAVYMEVDVEPRQQVAEAEWILEVCRQANTQTRAAVISGRPAADDFAAYLNRFRGNRFLKGVRQVLHTPATPAGFCLSDNFRRGMRALDERGLSYDLCLRHTDLGDACTLAEALPNLKFILDHCGNPDLQMRDRAPWQRLITRLAGFRNVVRKVSGIVVNNPPERWTPDTLAPFVNHVLEAFGPERVMFGGDWPVCTLKATYRQWVDALKAIVRNRPADQQRKLFHDNAVRFYGLA